MAILTVLLFITAALLGMFLISYVLRDKVTPKGVAMIHGLVAASGIICLGILLFTSSVNAYISLVLFVMAAIGGFILIYRDITGKSVPKWLALGHGSIAILAFILLIAALLRLF